jgi:hypothetical protein
MPKTQAGQPLLQKHQLLRRAMQRPPLLDTALQGALAAIPPLIRDRSLTGHQLTLGVPALSSSPARQRQCKRMKRTEQQALASSIAESKCRQQLSHRMAS